MRPLLVVATVFFAASSAWAAGTDVADPPVRSRTEQSFHEELTRTMASKIGTEHRFTAAPAGLKACPQRYVSKTAKGEAVFQLIDAEDAARKADREILSLMRMMRSQTEMSQQLGAPIPPADALEDAKIVNLNAQAKASAALAIAEKSGAVTRKSDGTRAFVLKLNEDYACGPKTP